MSNKCAECELDDIPLSCSDPRTPPLGYELCLCTPCGENAYRDEIQNLFDEMYETFGEEKAIQLWKEAIR